MLPDLFHAVSAYVHSYYGAPQIVSHILIECHVYNEYSTLRDILGCDRHSVSDVLAFLNFVVLVKYCHL
jgi:hypothetical protein